MVDFGIKFGLALMSLPAASPRKIRLGDLELDLQTGELCRNGDRLILQGQPFQVLAVLLERPGELVTREELKKRLWPSDTFVDFDHSLNKAVNRLREALGDSADAPNYVETIPRRGYRFIGSLEHSAQPRLIGFPERTPELITPEPIKRQRGIATRSWKIATLVGSVLLAASGLVLFRDYRRPASSLSLSALQVMPLTTLPGEEISPTFSPDGSQVAFGWNGETHGLGFDLYVMVIGSDKPLRLTNHPAPALSAAWSPDGRSIALRRVDLNTKNGGIFLVSALGGPERKLASTNDQLILQAEISWSPDGARLAFADHAESTDVLSSQLFVLSLETLERKQVETGCSHVYDTAFSPNGAMLAYACGLDVGQSSLNLTELGTSRQQQLFSGPLWIGGLTWSRDGQRIVFSAASSGDLWQVRITGNASAEKIGTVHDSLSPTINSHGDRLAYVESRANINAWRVELGGGKAHSYALAPSTRQQFHPVISPDGKRVAFVSNRSGTFNIWVCDRDGGNLQQLTSFADAVTGSPQWSPDGKQIAFDSRIAGEPNVYVVDANGGIPRKLETWTRLNSLPSWSHDGRWIYFASGLDISSLTIWRTGSTGGKASQLTKTPSLKPIESPDGQYLYFARLTTNKVRLWRARPDGSDEKMLEAIPPLSDAHQWWPSGSGIYFWIHTMDKPEVDFLDLRTSQIRRIYVPHTLPTPWLAGLSVSPDGKWLVYSRVDERFQDLMLVNNFR